MAHFPNVPAAMIGRMRWRAIFPRRCGTSYLPVRDAAQNHRAGERLRHRGERFALPRYRRSLRSEARRFRQKHGAGHRREQPGACARWRFFPPRAPSSAQHVSQAIKFDACYAPGSALATMVKDLAGRNYAGEPLLEEAGEDLRRYDLCSDKDNRGAGLGIVTAAPLCARARCVTIRSCFCAMRRMACFPPSDGSILPGEASTVCAAAHFDLPLSGGPDALRDIEFQRLPGSGKSVAAAGDALVLFSTWARNGAWSVDSIVPYGSSAADGGAPHYADQAQLFAGEKLKTVPLTDAALESEDHGGRTSRKAESRRAQRPRRATQSKPPLVADPFQWSPRCRMSPSRLLCRRPGHQRSA